MFLFVVKICIVFIVFLFMIEYMAINSGGYLCMSSVRALKSKWLNASQRNRDDV